MPTGQPMITDPDDFESPRPVNGILSIAAPVVGFALAIILCGILCGYPRRGPGSTNLEVFGYLVVIMPVAFLAGTILAIVALRRRESRALAVTGLVLNAGPLLLVLFLVVVTILLN